MLLDAVSVANKARVPLECPQVSSHESLAFVRQLSLCAQRGARLVHVRERWVTR